MAVPKPQDPRGTLSLAQLESEIDQILGIGVGSLQEEYVQLDRAHAVLREALQEN